VVNKDEYIYSEIKPNLAGFGQGRGAIRDKRKMERENNRCGGLRVEERQRLG